MISGFLGRSAQAGGMVARHTLRWSRRLPKLPKPYSVARQSRVRTLEETVFKTWHIGASHLHRFSRSSSSLSKTFIDDIGARDQLKYDYHDDLYDAILKDDVSKIKQIKFHVDDVYVTERTPTIPSPKYVARVEHLKSEYKGDIGFLWTPITLACFHGSTRVLAYFLELGGDFNAPGPSGRTPLEIAASVGNDTILDLVTKAMKKSDRDLAGVLVRFGTVKQISSSLASGKINVTGGDGIYPVHAAIENFRNPLKSREECAEILRLLLAHGAGSNQKGNSANSKNISPLSLAVAVGAKDAVELLCEHGADVQEVCDDQHLVDIASMCGQVDIAIYLVKRGAKILGFTQQGPGYRFLDRVVSGQYDQEKLIDALDQVGYDFNQESPEGCTMIQLLIQNHKLEAVRQVIKVNKARDIDVVNYEASNGVMPLAQAIDCRDYVLTRLLIDEGADLDYFNESSGIVLPIIHAMRVGDTRIARLLLERGASLELEPFGQTKPLVHATYLGRRDMVKLLIEFGVNLEDRDSAKVTALDLANANGLGNIVTSLTDGIQLSKRAKVREARFAEALKKIKEKFGTQKERTCFIHYAWGNKRHEQWVNTLVIKLRLAGIRMVYDKTDNLHSGNIREFTGSIKTCDFVMVVGTKQLKEKYKGFEKVYISRKEIESIVDIYRERSSAVFPILLEGETETAFIETLHESPNTDFRKKPFVVTKPYEYYQNIFGIVQKFLRIDHDDPDFLDIVQAFSDGY